MLIKLLDSTNYVDSICLILSNRLSIEDNADYNIGSCVKGFSTAYFYTSHLTRHALSLSSDYFLNCNNICPCEQLNSFALRN